MDERKKMYLINPFDDLKSAMIVIEKNEHRCAVVVDDNNKVIGILSDGDIRRYLLHNHLLISKVKDIMNLNFHFLNENNLEEAKKIFENLKTSIIPVIDNEGYLIDILESY